MRTFIARKPTPSGILGLLEPGGCGMQVLLVEEAGRVHRDWLAALAPKQAVDGYTESLPDKVMDRCVQCAERRGRTRYVEREYIEP